MGFAIISQGQGIGSGPLGFLFRPAAMGDLVGQVASVYVTVAAIMIVAAACASLFQRGRSAG